ncbi:hypothetical protein DFJ73DRAFT_60578 [Zopfochytrium polystomum]|nr:hypothetical protein DFJ73DRAFT_60578 [Zopfochytrium polystomum]
MAVVEGPALRRWTKMRVVESDEEDAGESDNKHVAAAESEQTVSGTECSKLAEEMVVEVGTEEGAGTIPKTEGTAVQGDPRPTLPTTLDSAQKSGGGMVDSLRPSLESAATCTKTSLVRPELTDSKDLLKNEKVGAPATAHGAPTKKRRQKLALGLSGHQVLADENHSQTARQSDGLQVSAILNDRNELVVGADAQRATAIAPASPDVRTAVPPNGHMTDEEMMHTTQALPERTSLGLPLYAITLEPDPFIVTRNDENVAQDTPLNKQQGPLQIGDKQRYFVDLQLALCFGLASGRDLLARLEPFSPTVSRVAPIRAREALQNSQVAVALLDAVLTRGARTVEAAAAHPQQQQQQQQHSCGQRTARFVRWVENADGRRALRMDAVDVLLLEVESVRRALAAAGVAEPDFGWTVPADGDVVDLVLDLARETTLAPEKKTPQDGGPSDVKAKYPRTGYAHRRRCSEGSAQHYGVCPQAQANGGRIEVIHFKLGFGPRLPSDQSTEHPLCFYFFF